MQHGVLAEAAEAKILLSEVRAEEFFAAQERSVAASFRCQAVRLL
jgi:hypothetical protein